MLNDNLYTIADLKENAGTVNAAIELNEQHAIFKGHFPGKPVLPGVFALQIVKGILSSALHRTLQMRAAGDIKFLQMIDPVQNNKLEVIIRLADSAGDEINVRGTILQENKTCIKLNAIFIPAEFKALKPI